MESPHRARGRRTTKSPPVSTSRLSSQFWAITAKASVMTARNSPRTRSAGNPTTTAVTKQAQAARNTAPSKGIDGISNSRSPMEKFTPRTMAVVSMAPSPAKANCPSES